MFVYLLMLSSSDMFVSSIVVEFNGVNPPSCYDLLLNSINIFDILTPLIFFLA